MNKEFFLQYQDICAEINDLEESISEMEWDPQYAQQCHDYIVLWGKQLAKKKEIESFVRSLHGKKKQLAKAVMKYGPHWDVVRRKIGSDKSADALRVEFSRLFVNNP